MKLFKLIRHSITCLLCLFGIIWPMLTGGYLSHGGLDVSFERYGGDAYTGIQNAAAKTANNVGDLINALYDFQAWVLFLLSIIFTIIFLKNLEIVIYIALDMVKKRKQKKLAQNLEEQSASMPVEKL